MSKKGTKTKSEKNCQKKGTVSKKGIKKGTGGVYNSVDKCTVKTICVPLEQKICVAIIVAMVTIKKRTNKTSKNKFY